MPYVVAKHDSCPASRPWGVTNQQTGTLHGCHATKTKAQAQQRALYAAENRAAPLNTGLQEQAAKVESENLPRLVADYEAAINQVAEDSSKRFALTAAADWQPPAQGAIITTAEIVAVSHELNKKLAPVWERVVVDSVRPVLARIEIDWTVKHPLAQNILASAGQRTGARLDEAVQFTLRETLAHAYDTGLNVHDTSLLIQKKISDAAPYQAEMLARSDLNSLANGASKAAAQLSGIGFKTWLATLDDKTRIEHAEAHGQTVSLNDTFTVGGEDADYPGDPNLSDAMACNCRCTLAYGDTLSEAEGLTAGGGSSIMDEMATKEQRRRKYQRRAAHSLGKKQGALTEPELIGIDPSEEASDVTSSTADKSNGSSSVSALLAAPRSIAFSGTAAIEGQIADDNSLTPRVLLPDSLEWPEMPVSFMAQTQTAEGHDGAEVAGRVDELARKKSTGKKRSIYMAGELTTPFGINEIAPMIDDKTMRYVSADLGATEWSIVNRDTLDVVPMDELSLEELQQGAYALALTSGKVKAVTLVPAQALEGALVALTASAEDDTATLTFEIELETSEGEALVASRRR